VDHDHQKMAGGWVDNRAVHFISTADTTDIVTVTRKVGNAKVEVMAPVAVSNYNKYMGGVDRHDQLRSSFSLCKAHHFKKYYVKLMLFLVDIGLTNAWIYYKKCNKELCAKEGSRANFFQSVAEEMVNVNAKWAMYWDKDNDFAEDDAGADIDTTPKVLNVANCVPTSLEVIPAKIGTKMKSCQVCSYEMRGFKWKSVTLCPNHGARLCTDARKSREESEPKLIKKDGSPVTDWDWTCQSEDTCWNKFHDFYLPNGLFNNNISLSSSQKCKFAEFVCSSDLYQKKYAALGIPVKRKNGKTFGKGLIQDKVHMVLNNDKTSAKKDKGRGKTNKETGRKLGRMVTSMTVTCSKKGGVAQRMETNSRTRGGTKEIQYLQQDSDATQDNSDGNDDSNEEYLGDEDSKVSEDKDDEDSVDSYYSCSSNESN